MKDEALFECFRSKALIDGKVMLIGTEQSVQLWKNALRAGLIPPGVNGNDADWKVRVVMLLRHSTTAPPYDHEYWGAQTFLPDWAQRVQEFYLHDWRYFPNKLSELSARALGERIGYSLTLGEMLLKRILEDEASREQWERREFQSAIQGQEDLADRTQIIYPGFESSQQMLEAARESTHAIRAEVLKRVAEVPDPDEHGEFTEAYVAGGARARKELPERLTAYAENTEIAKILVEHATYIVERCDSRTDVSKLVRKYLPERRRTFLADETNWSAFTERMREIYEKVGYRPRGRGRPRKKREIE